MLGPEGDVLELIPSDPAAVLSCRPLSRDSEAGRLLTEREHINWSKPAFEVDIPGGGKALAFWIPPYEGIEWTSYAVNARGFTSIIAEDWPGTHTFAQVAFEDGPKALRAAIECLERQSPG